MAETLHWLCARLDAGLRTRVAFLNAHCVNQAASDDYSTSVPITSPVRMSISGR